MKLDEIDKCRVPKDEMQEGGLSHEDPTNLRSKVPQVSFFAYLFSRVYWILSLVTKVTKFVCMYVCMFICFMQKLQDDLQTLGTKLQLHEDNIRFLRTLKDKLVDSIIDLQGIFFFLPQHNDVFSKRLHEFLLFQLP